MCGCSNFVNNDERDIITETELNQEFDFTGNRPSLIEVGEDPSFDFVGDLDGNTEFDYFLNAGGKERRQKRRANRQERRASRKDAKDGTEIPQTRSGELDPTAEKNAYGTSSWFSNNWIYLVIGVAVVGGGYYFYKKRK